MRFDELTLEKYGAFERRTLTLTPGLNVVHGPNEGGKSTCMHAIRDFLFRIPERSPRSAKFGSDAARIGARLTTAAGAPVSLRRRCGRGRTLIDEAGAPCEDAVLSALLGAVDRDRFETLFGLDHEGLRKGGEALLSARGDIGRLIVEAGGGLRALVDRLDGLETRIDALFAPRRKAGRAFYDALTAHDAADKASKAEVLTWEMHERDRRAAVDAAAETARLRGERRGLGERASRLRCLARVVPILRRLDAAEEGILAFGDVAHLSGDFPERCGSLLDAHAAALGRRDEARGRLADVWDRRERLKVDDVLVAAEPELRDVEARLAVVRAFRGDRAARERDVGDADAQLGLLRDRLGLGEDADLVALLPTRPILRVVVDLAERDAGIGVRLRSARKEAAVAADVLSEATGRLEAMTARGHHRPFGIEATSFAALPSEWAAATSRIEAADRADGEQLGRAVELGMKDVAAVRRLACPDVEQVGAEIKARDALRAERARVISSLARAMADREAARVEMAALLGEGEVANGEAVDVARRTRDDAWASVRASYVGGQAPAAEAERHAMAGRLDASIADADRLADKRVAEADRVATLAQTRRRIATAQGAVEAAEGAARRLDRELVEAGEAFRGAFPEACALRPELASLQPFAAARRGIVEASDRTAAERRVAETALRDLAPAMARLAWAELRAGLASHAAAELGGRVRAVASAIGAHDRAHEAYLRERGAMPGLEERRRKSLAELQDVERERREWAAAWAAATAALGVGADEPVASTAALAGAWERARGDLRAVAQARALVMRMDEEEATLGGQVASIAGRIGLATAVDPVAAGDMLLSVREGNEAARLGREALGPEVAKAQADVAGWEEELGSLGRRLATIADEIGGARDLDRLRATVVRGRRLAVLRRERDALGEAARVAGDDLPLQFLRGEAEGCDLDAVRAESSEIAGRLDALDGRIEGSIAEEVRTTAILRGHGRSPGDAGLVAVREAAVADMHAAAEQWVELKVAKDLLDRAIRVVRDERQDPLVREAGILFSRMTRGAYAGAAADVDDRGDPIVRGVRSTGGDPQPVATMSEGTRDQMFLAFRLASVGAYCAAAEPLPFVADDLLVHFDDGRAEATLDLLADFAGATQVLLFTHHASVRDAAVRLQRQGRTTVVEVAP
ncbi:YhaN family protein [Lichenibacterium dinghuense]|uniref:YhaN family protein n=1 Tax=Lichenibacterium dinghuense TaxID=2895977 RepID=UPI001F354DE5|nr:YhaN family protein [Lichenibacterium sp. 6Y81]